MKRLMWLFLAACLLFTGCGWLDGSYQSVTPHVQHGTSDEVGVVSAGNYLELRTALESLVDRGVESGVISVADFRRDQLDSSLEMAMRYVKYLYPLGAYAVEDITWEEGTVGADPAIAVKITYLYSRSEILEIQQVENMQEVLVRIGSALQDYDPTLVLLVDTYELTDLHQLVEDYVSANPQSVMEQPELSARIYPNSGKARVVELKFSYQSSRDSLRAMQEVVGRVFNSAALYVSADAQDVQKLSQLYSFLMERFDEYQIKTSITPAYSLLNHGVGDSEAFAVVYAAMCNRAGLSCQVVVGTRNGEPWYWNIVLDDGYYYHVDLTECQRRGGFQHLTDSQMANYVWDYSAYPACTGRPPEVIPEDPTQPPESEPTQEETQPAQTEPEKEI